MSRKVAETRATFRTSGSPPPDSAMSSGPLANAPISSVGTARRGHLFEPNWRCSIGQQHYPVRFAIFEGLEQHRANHGEHRGVGANPEGKGQNHCPGEDGILEHGPDPVLQVLLNAFEIRRSAHRRSSFPHWTPVVAGGLANLRRALSPVQGPFPTAELYGAFLLILPIEKTGHFIQIVALQ